MRFLGFCLVASTLLSILGCDPLSPRPKPPVNIQMSKDQVGPPSADNLVTYLNKQADRLAVIESTDVSLVAHVNKSRMPGLTGFMVCEKPRNFRLTGDAIGTQYVDIGSNGDKFWFWVKDGDSPLYYCSYTDYEKGVQLPLPFQPEWVVQALGMAKYDPAKQYRMEVKGGTYELIENATVQGKAVRKITVFSAGPITDQSQPRVVGHVVQDAQTGKVICKATIRRMRYASYRTPEGETSVGYPSDVLLEWPAEQLTMTLKIGKATVNERITNEASSRYFTLPNWQGIKAVDLARFRPSGTPTSRDVRQTGGQ